MSYRSGAALHFGHAAPASDGSVRSNEEGNGSRKRSSSARAVLHSARLETRIANAASQRLQRSSSPSEQADAVVFNPFCSKSFPPEAQGFLIDFRSHQPPLRMAKEGTAEGDRKSEGAVCLGVGSEITEGSTERSVGRKAFVRRNSKSSLIPFSGASLKLVDQLTIVKAHAVTESIFKKFDLVGCWIKAMSSPRKYESLPVPSDNFDPIVVISELFRQLSQPGNEKFLNKFIQEIPKSILHAHLAGEIHWEKLLDYAAKANMYVNPETLVFDVQKKKETDVAAKDLLEPEYIDLRDRLRKVMCVSQCSHPEPDKFFGSFKTIASITERMPISELLKLYISIALKHNIDYAELMIERPGPKLPEGWEKLFSEKESSEETWAEALKSLQESKWIENHVRSRVKELKEQVDLALHDIEKTKKTTVRFIIQVYRQLPLPKFFSELVAAMALVQNSKLCVGINLVGPEHQAYAIKHYDIHMQMIAFLIKFFPKVKVALHAGESTSDLSVATKDHIEKAIKVAFAKRLGHATDASVEDMLLAKEKQVAVEVCPSSCETILGKSIEKGPLAAFMRAEVPVVISTDDAGVAGATDITCEYVKVVQALKWDYETLRSVISNGYHYSFAENKEIKVRKFYRKLHSVESRIALQVLGMLEQGPVQPPLPLQISQQLQQIALHFNPGKLYRNRVLHQQGRPVDNQLQLSSIT